MSHSLAAVHPPVRVDLVVLTTSSDECASLTACFLTHDVVPLRLYPVERLEQDGQEVAREAIVRCFGPQERENVDARRSGDLLDLYECLA